MDANTLNSWILSLTTVVLFVSFILISVWAFGRGRRASFERAAQLPLEDDGDGAGPGPSTTNHNLANEVQK
ncbi:MAG: cbb3-type cytochrome oxidase subunit 3 [Lysobacterales bacterium]